LHTKTIYLIRHGETKYNKMGVVQGGGIDSDLNETGFAQAKAFYEFYKDVPFDKIYTSCLKRTVQSVQSFLDLGISHEALSGLNEISWGDKEGKVPNYLEDQTYLETIAGWSRGETHIPAAPNGESPEDVLARQKVAFHHIMSQTDEKIILVAMHGRAIRILLTYLLDLPLSMMDTFGHQNLCLYLLHSEGDTNKFKIQLRNDVKHLSKLIQL